MAKRSPLKTEAWKITTGSPYFMKATSSSPPIFNILKQSTRKEYLAELLGGRGVCHV